MIAAASQLVNVYAILKANKVLSAHIIASGAKIMSMIIIGMKSIISVYFTLCDAVKKSDTLSNNDLSSSDSDSQYCIMEMSSMFLAFCAIAWVRAVLVGVIVLSVLVCRHLLTLPLSATGQGFLFN